MVEGTVYLSSGQTVVLYAGDMLTALKMATGTYHGLAIRMDFKTMEVSNTDGREEDVHAEDHRQRCIS